MPPDAHRSYRESVRAAIEFLPPDAGRRWSFRVRSAANFAFGWHAHDDYELTAITAGSGTCFVGDSAVPYTAGHVALFGPRLPHTYASSGDSPQSAWVAQFGTVLPGRLLGEPEFRPVHSLLRRATGGALVANANGPLLDGLARLASRSGARQALALFEVLVEMAESHDLATMSSAGTAQPASSTLQQVMAYLERNFARPVTREEVAAAVALSPSSLSRMVRRELGTTVGAYLCHVRVAAACRALSGSDLSIADIAHTCGFANLANFNRQFRRQRYMTPREYRVAFRQPAPVRAHAG